MTEPRRAMEAWRGMTLLETAATLIIVAIITVPLAAVASRLIVLPVDWQENLEESRQAREALHWVASDARQTACYSTGYSPDAYGTFRWTDYTESTARTFSVQYYSNVAQADGTANLIREETVDNLPGRKLSFDSVRNFGIRQDGRLIRAWVGEPLPSAEVFDSPQLEIAALMRPEGPAITDC